jgi:hypothetical protein
MVISCRSGRVLLATAILVGMLTGCWADSFYWLTVVNRASRPVEVFVNGSSFGPDGEMVRPCSQYDFQPASYHGESKLLVEVKDPSGQVLMRSEATPRLAPGRYGHYEVVIEVPSDSGKECSGIAIIPTPTMPAAWRESGD